MPPYYKTYKESVNMNKKYYILPILLLLFSFLLVYIVNNSDNEVNEINNVNENNDVSELNDNFSDEDIDTMENRELEYKYLEYMDTIMINMANDLEDFSSHNSKLSENNLLKYDKDFVNDVVSTLISMDGNLKLIMTVESPDSLKHLDYMLKDYATQYKFVVDNYPKAIDYEDVELLNEITERMTRGNEILEEINNLKGD